MKNIFFLILLVYLMACTKYRTEDTMHPTINTQVVTCPTTGLKSTTDSCLVPGSGKYIYDTAFGGRGLEQNDVTGIDGALSVVVPDGWYSGKTALIIDSKLQAANITSGNTFFGVLGSLTAGAFAACGGIDSQIANAAACTLPSANYVYSSNYGGRANSCPAAGTVTSPCWLAGAGNYLNGSTATSCASQGLVSSNCSVPISKFWYNSSYGGRANICSIPGTNGSACWTNQNNIYVLDSSCVVDYNGSACVTTPSQYVYTSQYGGRYVNCTNNDAGSCYFNATKDVVEPNLNAANIVIGFVLFGITGIYNGSSTSWGSDMARDLSTAQFSVAAETTTYAGINSTLPAGYRAIPLVAKDSEGTILEAVPQVNKVNRTGWAAATCGTSGDIFTRISNCNTVFGANASWNGTTAGNAGQSIWQLVSRTADLTAGKGREVWQDTRTSLLWSSLVSTGINWCKAVGSSNSVDSRIVGQNLNEKDPSSICDQIFYQNQGSGIDVVSACSEFVGLTTTSSEIDNAGKAGLNKFSNPSVLWRAPSIYDYMIANADGLRYVLPDMQSASLGPEWATTTYSVDRSLAFTVDAGSGQKNISNRSYLNNLRCVGR